MWLINVKTYQLEEYIGEATPSYAILSHTWAEGEVSFHELKNSIAAAKAKEGFHKIEHTCRLARKHGLGYAWVDTCCINKESSAELQEAINSMFEWYRRAQRCYAYLCDVDYGYYHHDRILKDLPQLFLGDGDDVGPGSEPYHAPLIDFDRSEVDIGFGQSDQAGELALLDETDNDAHLELCRDRTKAMLARSRWFRRAWTLQELIAPPQLDFYDTAWNLLSSRESIATLVYDITKVDLKILRASDAAWSKWNVRQELDAIPAARKMSWAAGRKCTRREDEAYALLGLFDVNMALLYGEGDKAFIRLQEEILRHTKDVTILAWEELTAPSRDVWSDITFGIPGSSETLFAPSASHFRHAWSIKTSGGHRPSDCELVGRSVLRVRLPIIDCASIDARGRQVYDQRFLAVLRCYAGDTCICLQLRVPAGSFHQDSSTPRLLYLASLWGGNLPVTDSDAAYYGGTPKTDDGAISDGEMTFNAPHGQRRTALVDVVKALDSAESTYVEIRQPSSSEDWRSDIKSWATSADVSGGLVAKVRFLDDQEHERWQITRQYPPRAWDSATKSMTYAHPRDHIGREPHHWHAHFYGALSFRDSAAPADIADEIAIVFAVYRTGSLRFRLLVNYTDSLADTCKNLRADGILRTKATTILNDGRRVTLRPKEMHIENQAIVVLTVSISERELSGTLLAYMVKPLTFPNGAPEGDGSPSDMSLENIEDCPERLALFSSDIFGYVDYCVQAQNFRLIWGS
jgi:hypothetical protein